MIDRLRAIDRAMGTERAEKKTIREEWMKHIQICIEEADEEGIPLYLTLSGAEGIDIKKLIDEEILKLTKVGSIDQSLEDKVIAIESNTQAAAKLKKIYPGLNIINQNFSYLVGGNTLVNYPSKKLKKYCRSKIVNLDFDNSLSIDANGDTLFFRELNWVRKLCQIHLLEPVINWKLFLTFNATIDHWDDKILESIKNFLQDNFEREEEFKESCENFFEEELFEMITGEDKLDTENLSQVQKNKLMMIFVPKKLSQLVHNDGWSIDTEMNCHYGGENKTAPMVSWIFNFSWKPGNTDIPNQIYKECLLGILAKVVHIKDDGELIN